MKVYQYSSKHRKYGYATDMTNGKKIFTNGKS